METVPGSVLEPPQRILQVAVFYQVRNVGIARAPERLNSVFARKHKQGQRRFGGKGNATAVEEAQELAEDPLAFFCFFQFELLL